VNHPQATERVARGRENHKILVVELNI